jgi:3-methyladenine DNA glycosylase Mpg
MARPRVLDRAEIPVDTVRLAGFLIGKMLVRVLAEGVAAGRIVETEAYGIGDQAGHAYRGITPRNRAEQADRHYMPSRQLAAILRSRQSVRQRPTGAQ